MPWHFIVCADVCVCVCCVVYTKTDLLGLDWTALHCQPQTINSIGIDIYFFLIFFLHGVES